MRRISKQELLFELQTLTSDNPNNIQFDVDDIDTITSDVSKIYTMEFSVSTSLVPAFHERVQAFNHNLKGMLCHFRITSDYDMSNVISIMDTIQQDLDDEIDTLFAISYINDLPPSNMMMAVFITMPEKLVPVNNTYKI
ncbi:hypothetical protein [Sulfurimonas sp. HSL3-7]|uniref:hypothetical protein n=1 Tax=Sulfonitrofixus jiaomeiensis TaxID=3131938 RepID=UPI0031F98799